MTVKCFVDTNILLYSGSSAPADAVKAAKAAEILQRQPFGISGQVLQEFVANALGKKSLGYSEETVLAILENLKTIPTVPVTRELVLEALRLRVRHQLSYWDAAILAAALELRCEVLYSEDFNHGQVYDGVKAVNPFA